MARCMRMDCCKLRHIFSVFLNQRQHNGERRALPHFAVHRYGAVGKLHTIDMRRKDDMRLNVSTSIDVTARERPAIICCSWDFMDSAMMKMR